MRYRTGIYSITNTITGRRYFGSASDIATRWATHKSELRSNKHGNKHLQRAFNKYGEEAFEFRRIQEVPKEHLEDVEQEYLDRHWHEGLYNIRRYANRCMGMPHTEEAKQKMRDNYTGITPGRVQSSREHSRKMTGRRASKATRQKMSEVKLGYSHTKEARQRMSKSARKRSQEHIQKITAARSGRYVITTPEGAEVEILNLSAFALEHGLQQSKLSVVALGKANHHKGFKARRVE